MNGGKASQWGVPTNVESQQADRAHRAQSLAPPPTVTQTPSLCPSNVLKLQTAVRNVIISAATAVLDFFVCVVLHLQAHLGLSRVVVTFADTFNHFVSQVVGRKASQWAAQTNAGSQQADQAHRVQSLAPPPTVTQTPNLRPSNVLKPQIAVYYGRVP